VLAGQLRQARTVGAEIAGDGFAGIHPPAPVAVVGRAMVDSPALARRQQEAPLSIRFGLQISDFTWEGGPAATGRRLAAVAAAAEEAGFSGIWVMDHFRQIPQVGPAWHDMPESYTTLAYLAGVTDRVTLGTLVTGVGYRNPAHLAKIIATLDVLSGGRAVCGIGLGWFAEEATAYGWEQAPVATRYALLEDTLEVLRLMWGPGAPSFEGRMIRVPEAMCYPRPLQERIPILVGGGGETRTLRLVARHADMCNLFGDGATVRHKLEVLHRHCESEGRDPAEIEVTHLSQVLIGEDQESVRDELARLAAPDQSLEQTAERLGAGTAEDHIGRMRGLAEAGVQHAIVGLHGVADLSPIRRFADVIAAFR
jgi:F420-dependent oxidoreductase-like protein